MFPPSPRLGLCHLSKIFPQGPQRNAATNCRVRGTADSSDSSEADSAEADSAAESRRLQDLPGPPLCVELGHMALQHGLHRGLYRGDQAGQGRLPFRQGLLHRLGESLLPDPERRAVFQTVVARRCQFCGVVRGCCWGTVEPIL